MEKITKEDVFGTEFLKAVYELNEYAKLRKREIETDIYTSKFEKKIEIKRLEKEVKEKYLEAIKLV